MAASRRFIKFDEDQARRIVAAVRDYERTLPDNSEGDGPEINAAHVVNPYFAVRVTIDGGNPGSASTPCTWTYKVESLAGTLLGEGMTPKKRRYAPAEYDITPPMTEGSAYFDEEGELQLFDANELLAKTLC